MNTDALKERIRSVLRVCNRLHPISMVGYRLRAIIEDMEPEATAPVEHLTCDGCKTFLQPSGIYSNLRCFDECVDQKTQIRHHWTHAPVPPGTCAECDILTNPCPGYNDVAIRYYFVPKQPESVIEHHSCEGCKDETPLGQPLPSRCKGCLIVLPNMIDGAGPLRLHYTPKPPEPLMPTHPIYPTISVKRSPAPILKPTPEPDGDAPMATPAQLKALNFVLDGDAPRVCKEGDYVINDQGFWIIVGCKSAYLGKLRWHLKDAPPAPDDINKGVWFVEDDALGLGKEWKKEPIGKIDTVLVDGKKFTPEGVPDGFCQNSCGYFSLVRRFRGWLKNCHSLHSSLAKDFAELRAINAEVKRMFPKAGGE